MPGMNILSVPKEIEHIFSPRFSQVQENMLHSPFYSYEPILMHNGTMIGFTGYDSYPKKVLEAGSLLIAMEGVIYNYADSFVEKWLLDFASEAAAEEPDLRKLKEFLVKADGEFVVVVYDKGKNELYVFNDVMGRLPLYYHAAEDSLFISRETGFIVPFLNSIHFSKASLAEYLLFGFPLGENTFIEEIHRTLPATFIRFSARTRQLFKRMLVPLNFENKMQVGRHSKDQIADLKNLFLEGLRGRLAKSGNRKPIIFLSGGLDSRAVLAGLTSLNTKPTAVTHVWRDAWRDPGEEKYAVDVASAFGIDVTTLTCRKTVDTEDYARLVSMKGGLNPTVSAFTLDIYDQLSNVFGNSIVAFSGLYGGEMFRDLNVTMGINSVRDLSKFLLNTPDQYRYSARKACRMLSMDEDYLLQHLINHLSGYREKDVYRKYMHFKFEKDYKWAGEGEDRMRFFFWGTTPFYSVPFFNYSMSIDENRKDRLFFRNFLYALDPRTCEVRYYDDRSSLNNIWRLRLLSLAERLVRHPTIRRYVASIIGIKASLPRISKTAQGTSHETTLLRRLLLDLVDSSSEITKYLSLTETTEIVGREENAWMLHRILTLLLYMKHVEEMRQQPVIMR